MSKKSYLSDLTLKRTRQPSEAAYVLRFLAPLRRVLGPTLVATVLAGIVLGVLGSATADAAPGRRAAATTKVASPGPTPAGVARALWVWDQPSAKGLVAFAQQRGIRDLFVSVPNDLPSSPRLAWVSGLARLAAPAGLRLQALGGDPAWVDDPAGALAWQQAALSTGLFSGVHVDLEPWAHPDWETDRATVVAEYLSVLSRLAGATSLPVEADVSFWLWTVDDGHGGPLDAAVLDRVDRVTIMSYRTTVLGPDSITATGAHTLATAAAAGKPARLAVETNDLGDDPVARKQTFFGQTEAVLRTALDQVDTAEAGRPSYAGVAVEDHAGYLALR
jgi:hypothetical protein